MGKVAVVGSTGYIAEFIINELNKTNENDIILIDRSGKQGTYYLELREPEKFNYELLNDVDFLIFTAAISAPDKCAEAFEECWKINVEGTKYFINEAIARKCKVLFFSSDAVFGDIPGGIYYEESVTNAGTAYGKMKKEVEDAMKYSNCFKAVRLPYVVSAKDKFTSYCLNCIEKGERAEVYHPFYRSCITIRDVVKAVIWMKNDWENYPHWALNLAGMELVSRVRIADEINRVTGERLSYTIVVPDKDFFDNRFKITQMDSRYLQKFKIIDRELFTIKIKKELENIYE